MKRDGARPSGPGWSNRPVVLETDETQVRSHLRTLAICAVALVPLVAYIVEVAESRAVAYELTDVQLAYEQLTKAERDLAAERARLESLRGIEMWALRERGLCRPTPEDVVVLRADRRREAEWLARISPDARGAIRD